MFSALREQKVQRALSAEAPAFAISLLLTEAFYKFHSFTIELLAFLITWLSFSLVTRSIVAARSELPHGVRQSLLTRERQ